MKGMTVGGALHYGMSCRSPLGALPAEGAAQHDAVVGRLVAADGLAPGGVEIDLETRAVRLLPSPNGPPGTKLSTNARAIASLLDSTGQAVDTPDADLSRSQLPIGTEHPNLLNTKKKNSPVWD